MGDLCAYGKRIRARALETRLPWLPHHSRRCSLPIANLLLRAPTHLLDGLGQRARRWTLSMESRPRSSSAHGRLSARTRGNEPGAARHLRLDDLASRRRSGGSQEPRAYPRIGDGPGQRKARARSRTVAKYMVPRFRRPRPPSQSWKTFLRNHAAGIASIDLFVVPTAFFKLLYGLVILGHTRRGLIGLGVTAHPSAEWIARQVTEAFPWDESAALPDPRPRRDIRSSIYPQDWCDG